MATDYEDKIRQAGKKRSESYNDTGKQAADALTGAAGQFATETEQANAAYLQGLNDAQKLYQQRMDEGYTQFADIIAGSQRDAQAELAQEQQEIANKQKAARWTGAAELASSVANMIGVGSFNAANQQYKTYSQDWMRQADADMRAHRAKVGNLRERQRAMQQQLLQLRMNNAGQALQAAQRQAEAARKANEQSAAARRDAATAGVKVQLDAADRAAAAEYEGEVTAANMGQRQEQMAQQDRHFNAQMAQQDRHFNAQMDQRLRLQAAKDGFTIDDKGNFVPDETSPAWSKSSRSGGTKSNKDRYGFFDGDTYVPFFMSANEMKQFKSKAFGKLLNNPSFMNAYANAEKDDEREGIIFNYAAQDPQLKQELYTYSNSRPKKPADTQTAPVSAPPNYYEQTKDAGAATVQQGTSPRRNPSNAIDDFWEQKKKQQNK